VDGQQHCRVLAVAYSDRVIFQPRIVQFYKSGLPE
jgi:hypothetical protein